MVIAPLTGVQRKCLTIALDQVSSGSLREAARQVRRTTALCAGRATEPELTSGLPEVASSTWPAGAGICNGPVEKLITTLTPGRSILNHFAASSNSQLTEPNAGSVRPGSSRRREISSRYSEKSRA